MAEKNVTVKCECPDCGGTGLYKSAYCHDGAAVVCRKCDGTGCIESSYTPFTSRKKKEGVTRVFQSQAFVHFYPTQHTFNTGKTVDYSQYGCSLEEWENGVEPKPLP